MRSVYIFTALTILCCVALFGVGYSFLGDMAAPPAQNTQQAAQPAEKTEQEAPQTTTQTATTCDGTIIAQIGTVEMRVPRNFIFQLANARGALAQWSHPAFNCELTRLSDLHMLGEKQYWGLINPENGPVGKTQYAYIQRDIETALAGNAFDTLPDGTRAIEIPGADIYLLPAGKPPVKDATPATIYCATPEKGGLCASSYTLQNGLYLTYRFARTSRAADEVLEHDRQLRQMIDAMTAR